MDVNMLFSTSSFALLLGTLSVPTSAVLSAPTEKNIFVIRHGDKTYDYNTPASQTFACLSEMGWARAYNLVSLFGSASTRFPSPDAIFSAQYDANIIGGLERFGLSQEQAETILDRVNDVLEEKVGAGFRFEGNCRDMNGWYRTQQTVSAVAQDLGLTINNSTGFLPRFCLNEDPPYNPYDLPLTLPEGFPVGFSFDNLPDNFCVPYLSRGPNEENILENPYGSCCNPWAALQMVTEIEKPSVNNILVAWEHKNIQFLSRGLADFPPGNTEAVIEVGNQVATVVTDEDGNQHIVDNWLDTDFDRIYKFTYECDTSCSFVSLDTTLTQDFNWLGPKFGSGFSVPDDFEGTADEVVNFVSEDCIEGSSCPICPLTEEPLTGRDKGQAEGQGPPAGKGPPLKDDKDDDDGCGDKTTKKECKKAGCNWNASLGNGSSEQSCASKGGGDASKQVSIEDEGVTVAREQQPNDAAFGNDMKHTSWMWAALGAVLVMICLQ